jgi:hypothetical protein
MSQQVTRRSQYRQRERWKGMLRPTAMIMLISWSISKAVAETPQGDELRRSELQRAGTEVSCVGVAVRCAGLTLVRG